jgi:uncharacterized protein (DUF2141 family)
MKLRGFLIWVFLICCPTTVLAETLVVNVSGVKAGKGDVRVGVFNSADEFPDGKYFKGVAVSGDSETMRIEVKDLPLGNYAVSVFQDFNGNEKVDKNFLGIPKEPYGFSGKWKSGAASFEDAIIDLKPEGTEILIKMK